jgi:hypothetical protein
MIIDKRLMYSPRAAEQRRARMFFATMTLGIAALLALAILFSGCAGQKPVTVGTVNKDITLGIAEAGTVARTAETEYQQKIIPQTAANRTLINNLGAAYNTAKRAWLVVLNAESQARAATNAQLTACTPPAATFLAAGAPIATVQTTATCSDATAAAQQANTAIATAQGQLNSAIATMSSQTTAVKAITK